MVRRYFKLSRIRKRNKYKKRREEGINYTRKRFVNIKIANSMIVKDSIRRTHEELSEHFDVLEKYAALKKYRDENGKLVILDKGS